MNTVEDTHSFHQKTIEYYAYFIFTTKMNYMNYNYQEEIL